LQGFVPLVEGEPEPTPEQLARIVCDSYAAAEEGAAGSMGEHDKGVVFAGLGDPLLRVEALLETVALVASRQNGLAFRVNTNGLVGPEVVALLLASDVVTKGDADARRETRVESLSVALPCHDPPSYQKIMEPEDGKGFGDVCSFIVTLAEAGVYIECTAVDRPDVDLKATEKLALSLGARSFRSRPYHPAPGASL